MNTGALQQEGKRHDSHYVLGCGTLRSSDRNYRGSKIVL